MISAIAAALVFSFYQGGYAEGAYVSGYFVAADSSGALVSQGDVQCWFAPCGNVTSYHMQFSGNSRMAAFQQEGIAVLQWPFPDDGDNLLGIRYRLGQPYADFMASMSVSPSVERGPGWHTQRLSEFCEDAVTDKICGVVGVGPYWDSTAQRVSVVEVSEPHPLLISILALWIGLILHNKVDRRK